MTKITARYLIAQGLSPETPARFFAKIMPSPSCWIWIGKRNSHGYGKLNALEKGKQKTAHRISWTLHFGPIPKGMNVLHDCPGGDNPACVNPAHIWLGTTKDNALDMKSKGRSTTGEKNAMHKLTLEKAIAIRSSKTTCSSTAKLFGVSNGTVSMIRNGKRWAHIAHQNPPCPCNTRQK